jgi:hypothetical protein
MKRVDKHNEITWVQDCGDLSSLNNWRNDQSETTLRYTAMIVITRRHKIVLGNVE